MQTSPDQTTLKITEVPVKSEGTEAAVKADVLAYLKAIDKPLFAVLDGARHPRITSLLREYGADVTEQKRTELQALPAKPIYQSLYTGKMREETAEQGPWFVYLPKDTPLLADLVQEGWGDAWGIYLVSEAGFKQQVRHLRRLMFANLPDGTRALFRFYDPRVLRNFVSICSTQQWKIISFKVTIFVFEGKSKELKRIKF